MKYKIFTFDEVAAIRYFKENKIKAMFYPNLSIGTFDADVTLDELLIMKLLFKFSYVENHHK